MGNYSSNAYRLAKLLESLPATKRLLKRAYVYLGYFLNKPRVHNYELAEGVELSVISCDPRYESFFGYFDRCPWSHSGQYLAFHQRALNSEIVDIVLLDHNSKLYSTVAKTTAWSVQQGAMISWIGGKDRFIFNIVNNRKLGSRIMSTDGRLLSEYDYPVQVVHPGGREFLSINYKRLFRMGSEYGYRPEVDNFKGDEADYLDGIWKIDLDSGRSKLVLSLADIAEVCGQLLSDGYAHKVNHVSYSPSGQSFVFIYRVQTPSGRVSRLLHSENGKLKVVMNNRVVSHFTWLSEEDILVWGRGEDGADGYYKINLRLNHQMQYSKVLSGFRDGHPTTSFSQRWVVTDTYPDRSRFQKLYLLPIDGEKVTEIGKFFSPLKYMEANRCDLHPRWSRDDKVIAFDSAHDGVRRMYCADISKLLI